MCLKCWVHMEHQSSDAVAGLRVQYRAERVVIACSDDKQEEPATKRVKVSEDE